MNNSAMAAKSQQDKNRAEIEKLKSVGFQDESKLESHVKLSKIQLRMQKQRQVQEAAKVMEREMSMMSMTPESKAEGTKDQKAHEKMQVKVKSEADRTIDILLQEKKYWTSRIKDDNHKMIKLLEGLREAKAKLVRAIDDIETERDRMKGFQLDTLNMEIENYLQDESILSENNRGGMESLEQQYAAEELQNALLTLTARVKANQFELSNFVFTKIQTIEAAFAEDKEDDLLREVEELRALASFAPNNVQSAETLCGASAAGTLSRVIVSAMADRAVAALVKEQQKKYKYSGAGGGGGDSVASSRNKGRRSSDDDASAASSSKRSAMSKGQKAKKAAGASVRWGENEASTTGGDNESIDLLALAGMDNDTTAASAAGGGGGMKSGVAAAIKEFPSWLTDYIHRQATSHALQLVQGHPLAAGAAVDMLSTTAIEVVEQMKEQLAMALLAYFHAKGVQVHDVVATAGNVRSFDDITESGTKMLLQEGLAHVLQVTSVHAEIVALTTLYLTYLHSRGIMPPDEVAAAEEMAAQSAQALAEQRGYYIDEYGQEQQIKQQQQQEDDEDDLIDEDGNVIPRELYYYDEEGNPQYYDDEQLAQMEQERQQYADDASAASSSTGSRGNNKRMNSARIRQNREAMEALGLKQKPVKSRQQQKQEQEQQQRQKQQQQQQGAADGASVSSGDISSQQMKKAQLTEQRDELSKLQNRAPSQEHLHIEVGDNSHDRDDNDSVGSRSSRSSYSSYSSRGSGKSGSSSSYSYSTYGTSSKKIGGGYVQAPSPIPEDGDEDEYGEEEDGSQEYDERYGRQQQQQQQQQPQQKQQYVDGQVKGGIGGDGGEVVPNEPYMLTATNSTIASMAQSSGVGGAAAGGKSVPRYMQPMKKTPTAPPGGGGETAHTSAAGKNAAESSRGSREGNFQF